MLFDSTPAVTRSPITEDVKRWAISIPTIMLLLLPACSSQLPNATAYQGERQSIAANAEDRQAIQTIYQNWYTAWETKDYKLASQDYSDDAIWVNAFGARCVGRAEIEATLKRVFGMSSIMAGQSTTVQKTVQFIGSDVALVTSRIERVGQQMQSGALLPTRQTSHLRVFAKSDGKWQIVSHLISDARSKATPEH